MNITFDAQGGRDFANLTEKNVGRRMAIVLDGNVNSAPQIQEKIPNGTGRITMGRIDGRRPRSCCPRRRRWRWCSRRARCRRR